MSENGASCGEGLRAILGTNENIHVVFIVCDLEGAHASSAVSLMQEFSDRDAVHILLAPIRQRGS